MDWEEFKVYKKTNRRHIPLLIDWDNSIIKKKINGLILINMRRLHFQELH